MYACSFCMDNYTSLSEKEVSSDQSYKSILCNCSRKYQESFWLQSYFLYVQPAKIWPYCHFQSFSASEWHLWASTSWTTSIVIQVILKLVDSLVYKFFSGVYAERSLWTTLDADNISYEIWYSTQRRKFYPSNSLHSILCNWRNESNQLLGTFYSCSS